MNTLSFRRIWLTRKVIYILGRRRASDVLRKIEPYLYDSSTVLELGSGTCNVAELLRDKGFILTIVDVKDLSFVAGLRPIICDSKTLPFQDNSFDVATVLDVLHHAAKPETLVKEARRVAKRVIVMENISNFVLQRLLFAMVDSLLNMEFMRPQNYRSDNEWQNLFRGLGFRLIHSDSAAFWLLFRSQTYVLDR